LDEGGDDEAEAGHHLEAEPEGVRVTVAEGAVEDRPDHRDSDRAARLLGGGQHPGGGRRVVGPDPGQHDGRQRRDHEAHADPGDHEPGDEPAGAVLQVRREQQVAGRHDQRAKGHHLRPEPGRELARLH